MQSSTGVATEPLSGQLREPSRFHRHFASLSLSLPFPLFSGSLCITLFNCCVFSCLVSLPTPAWLQTEAIIIAGQEMSFYFFFARLF